MSDPQPLTRHPEGSVRELWSISFPLMISALASLMMIFVDRVFLSNYSLKTFNAAVSAGTWAWAFMGGFGMLTVMSEVLVSQYNGAKEYKKIGVPAWQMIWVSLFSLGLFIPLSLWGGKVIFPNSEYFSLQNDYFSILMLFAPSYALLNAVSGFFIGRGKTSLLIWLALSANLINIFLDWCLIYGIDGWVPELGIKGAALATCFGYLFEAAILLAIFLKKEYRESYGSDQYGIDRATMYKCIRIGIPQAVCYTLEIMAFAVFYQMMTSVSVLHITICSICQSILILLSFFFDGLSRGAAAIAGNFIGAKRFAMTQKLLKSGIKLQLLFSFLLGFCFLFSIEKGISKLFSDEWSTLSKITVGKESELLFLLRASIFYTYIYLAFEGIRWVLTGILTAAGDTVFLLIASTTTVWGLLLCPVYFTVVQYSLSVEIAWMLNIVYSFLSCIIYWMRFKGDVWKKVDLVRDEV